MLDHHHIADLYLDETHRQIFSDKTKMPHRDGEKQRENEKSPLKSRAS